jgi:peptidoglycan L-alanyl-D-glutamate endopeptidase CwlK
MERQKEMSYKFSKTSRKRLQTCHPDLILIMNEALRASEIDFGIAEGHRPVERQKELYAKGRTQPGKIVTHIDGINDKGKHNYCPSLAVDVYAWVNGKVSWESKDLNYLAGLFMGIAYELRKDELITHDIRWGGNWDMDGVILDDQSFDDLPHIEIIKRQK